MLQRDFNKWTVKQLQQFLKDRNVNITGNKTQLAKNAYYAYCLNLPVELQTEEELREEYKNDHITKRKYMGSLLPQPDTLKSGWVFGSMNFPDVTHDKVMTYLTKNNAGKALKGGKSLFDSGHVSEVRFHHIDNTINLCYICAYCLPEQKVNNPVYDVWVLALKIVVMFILLTAPVQQGELIINALLFLLLFLITLRMIK